MSTRSILIVDDDDDVRESLRDELSPIFEVTCAESGTAALEALEKRQFDLLLSDVRMPGMDGVELARRARKIDPEIMRVLITGYADEHASLAVREDDGVYKLNKPWKDELESVLRRALEHRERMSRMSEMVGQMDRLAGLGRMLMCVVHDMSSPLSYVQANVNTLARDLAVPGAAPDPVEAGELLTDVREGVRRIVELVKRLRDYAAPGQLESTVIPLSGVIEAALRTTHSQFLHRVVVDVRKASEDPPVRITGRNVEQIVVNLLLRAAGAMDWRGQVTMDVGARDGWATLSVTDTGPAIPDEILERMFDPFFTREGQSDGEMTLGLAVSRDLATRCGGRLTARSAPDRGCTFTLDLPRLLAA